MHAPMNEQLMAYIFVGMFGLSIGSFINVIIYRLPIILYQNKGISLWLPSSHCPHCEVPLKIWCNIPIVSYIILKGKCSSCREPISVVYPLVEIAASTVTIILFTYYGVTLESASLLFITSLLIVLSAIDIQLFKLPNILTLLLLAVGILLNLFEVFTTFTSSILGAALGYFILRIISEIYKYVRGVEAIGHGDMKLLAAIGAWIGYSQLHLVLLIASVSGLLFGLVSLIVRGQNKIPFGPHLSIGAIFVLYLTTP